MYTVPSYLFRLFSLFTPRNESFIPPRWRIEGLERKNSERRPSGGFEFEETSVVAFGGF